ncbi:RHS repeat domain-containing protein [Apibacter adventoris]|uniref:RHS repeat domain-containing protein n=1 Tax=Apibacter adventoris TaxID=1679466 RepID=UPI0026A7960D|nr:RHS repeat-associated core domain-containing protein [Apibacter adventoris]
MCSWSSDCSKNRIRKDLQRLLLNKDHYAYFEVPYHGKDHNDYVNGAGFCCEGKDKKLQAYGGGIGKGNEEYEKMQYYYHADHLGSSSYITNLDAQIVQHVEYVPFGEVFIEERNQSWNTPYLFNGKELDEETGLYYYGARYYNPRESIFLSVDPMFEETMTPYQYTYQNPIRFTDPTGMKGEWTGVTKNEDGSYTVVAGEADNDRNIYVMDSKGNRTDEVVGQSLTEYSFFLDEGQPAIGAIINPGDMSGNDFMNNEIINNPNGLGLTEYMRNVTGGELYDFKDRGFDEKSGGMTTTQYHYRGMLFSIDEMKLSNDNLATFASARDFGNAAAGYVAGRKGISWMAARTAFDGLQTAQGKNWKTGKWQVEGQPTQRAERAGHTAGMNAFKRAYSKSLEEVKRAKAQRVIPFGPK